MLLAGFVPQPEIVTNPAMLYIAIGILGATVMPHNLYLHSAIVQTRRCEPTATGPARGHPLRHHRQHGGADPGPVRQRRDPDRGCRRRSTRPARSRSPKSRTPTICSAPMLGASLASTLFARGAAGLRARTRPSRRRWPGQIVMEGFLRHAPAGLAAASRDPVAGHRSGGRVALVYGESGTAKLLVLSQVVLSLQLPFAVVPLVRFTSDRAKMGELVAPRWVAFAGVDSRRDHHLAQHQVAVRLRHGRLIIRLGDRHRAQAFASSIAVIAGDSADVLDHLLPAFADGLQRGPHSP